MDARERHLLGEYARVTRRDARTLCQRADLLTFPEGERLKVLPVPEFLRHQFPTAAYHPARRRLTKTRPAFFGSTILARGRAANAKRRGGNPATFRSRVDLRARGVSRPSLAICDPESPPEQTAPAFSPRHFLRGLDALVRKNVRRLRDDRRRRSAAHAAPRRALARASHRDRLRAAHRAMLAQSRRAVPGRRASASPLPRAEAT